MPTIRDVAQSCGLSAMTVSAVLNGKPGQASEETRARVLEAVRDLGYHPNAIARGLARRRMDTIGVISSFTGRPSLMADRYFGPVFDGLLLGAQKARQRTLIVAEDSWDDVEQRIPHYRDGRCDGLVFITPTFPSAQMAPLVRQNFPVVFLGENRPDLSVSVVDMDNVLTGDQATTKLLERGHRRIAYIGGDDVLRSCHEREEGYRNACARAGVELDPTWIAHGSYSEEAGYGLGRKLAKLPVTKRPTALFCGDDAIAVGALRAWKEAGFAAPRDVSVIGINDDPIALQGEPPLSTFRQPLRALGESAVELLLKRIRSPREVPQRVLLAGEWIERETVGSPPCVERRQSRRSSK